MVSDPPSRLSALHLAEINVRTLFTHDAAGRLLATNEPRGRPAPRLFVVRTSSGVIWRARHDLPVAVVERLAAVIAGEPISDDLEGPVFCLPAVRAVLEDHGPVVGVDGGPEYCFPDHVEQVAGAVAVTSDNAHVLERWLPEWIPDVASELPIRVVLVDGWAVSICACARLPGRATHAGIETHAAFRGRGGAVIATAAWAAAMHERRVIPLYGTSWSNRASQRVAAKLGLLRYGASLSID